MKLLKITGVLFIGIALCLLVIVFMLLPSILLILASSWAIDNGIIADTPTIEAIIEILAFALPFPMTVLIQKIWERLDPLFDKFDKF